jgi:hypothetical protein
LSSHCLTSEYIKLAPSVTQKPSNTITTITREYPTASITMSDIPQEQWAQVIEKTGGPVEYKKIPVQKPGPDEVLVNIKYSGVCHTDLHAVNGDWPLVRMFSLLSIQRC